MGKHLFPVRRTRENAEEGAWVSVFGKQNGDFLKGQTVQGLQAGQVIGRPWESDVPRTCPDMVRYKG